MFQEFLERCAQCLQACFCWLYLDHLRTILLMFNLLAISLVRHNHSLYT
jgi:hypothetical protein